MIRITKTTKEIKYWINYFIFKVTAWSTVTVAYGSGRLGELKFEMNLNLVFQVGYRIVGRWTVPTVDFSSGFRMKMKISL